MADAFRRLQGHLLKRLGGDREMVDILALEVGVPSKTLLLNLLHRLVDAKRPAPDIDAPQALSLFCEPKADVERYDALRMAQAVIDFMEQASPAFEVAVPMLSQLLKAETAEREVKSQ